MERIIAVELLALNIEKDDLGQQIEKYEITGVFVGVLTSISQSEWFAASQLGMKPEMRVLLRDDRDFSGESYARVNDVVYSIYRTFLKDDGGIELYLRKDCGPNL